MMLLWQGQLQNAGGFCTVRFAPASRTKCCLLEASVPLLLVSPGPCDASGGRVLVPCQWCLFPSPPKLWRGREGVARCIATHWCYTWHSPCKVDLSWLVGLALRIPSRCTSVSFLEYLRSGPPCSADADGGHDLSCASGGSLPRRLNSGGVVEPQPQRDCTSWCNAHALCFPPSSLFSVDGVSAPWPNSPEHVLTHATPLALIWLDQDSAIHPTLCN